MSYYEPWDPDSMGFPQNKSSNMGWLKGFLGAFGGAPGMALASFGLPLLGNILGGGRAQQKGFQQWQNMQKSVMSGQFLGDRISTYMPLMNQMSQGQRGSILTNANGFQNTLARNLASSGMNRTGIGALASTAASSMAGTQLLDLTSENRRNAMGLAMQDRNNMMSLINMGPQSFENPYLNSIGEGADTFMQYLMDKRRPQSRPQYGGYYG